jgi:hypothetical protein
MITFTVTLHLNPDGHEVLLFKRALFNLNYGFEWIRAFMKKDESWNEIKIDEKINSKRDNKKINEQL